MAATASIVSGKQGSLLSWLLMALFNGVGMSNVYYLCPGMKETTNSELDELVNELQLIARRYHDYNSLPDIIRKCLSDARIDVTRRNKS